MAHSKKQAWAYLVGAGLALSPIHNSWLTRLVTDGNGEVGFFLPAFGVFLWFMGSLMFLLWEWQAVKARGLGEKRVWISLVVIACAIALSGISIDGRWQDKVSPAFMAASLFALYLVSRVLGRRVYIPIGIGALLASLGMVAYAAISPGKVSGGFVFETNYDIVVGYVLLGTAFMVNSGQWVMVSLALITMFFSGSPEGVFAVAVSGGILAWRKDKSWITVACLIPVVLVVTVYSLAGYTGQLYNYTAQVAANEPTIRIPPAITSERPKVSAVAGRWEVIQYSMTHIKPFGEGYNITNFAKMPNVHNVPLVLIQQLGYPGIIAALAWLWIALWGLRETRWKYVWALVLILSVFDHFIWTQLGSWWWAIVGVSSVNNLKSDLIFRGAKWNDA